MSEENSDKTVPKNSAGELGLTIPYYPHSGRRSHVILLPTLKLREYLQSKGWTPWGAFCRKCIRGREIFLFVSRDHQDFALCRFVPKDDFWADSTRKAREREAAERRRSFQLISTADS